MPGRDFAIVFASFLTEYDREVTAVLAVLLATLLAKVVDAAIARRGRAIAVAVTRGELTPVADTRLAFVRRAVVSGILIIGFAVAISQFSSLQGIATSVLASGALAAAVIGFAARQTLANVVAGVMLAITQPLRIGDDVDFEGHEGTVEDVRLNYTYLRTPAGQRIVIPNERLAMGVLRNDTITSGGARAEASVWMAAGADIDRALEVLAEIEGAQDARVAEVTADGVRITVAVDVSEAALRSAQESQLRALALSRLRDAGVLEPGPDGR